MFENIQVNTRKC